MDWGSKAFLLAVERGRIFEGNTTRHRCQLALFTIPQFQRARFAAVSS
jgi:hypothetical protein